MPARALVALTLAAAALAASAPPPATATLGTLHTVADLLDAGTYKVRTTYRRPNGQLFTKTTPGIIELPTFINVQPELVSLADVRVSALVLSPSRARVTIARLASAPSPLPLSVELIFDLPGGPTRLAVGYDGLIDKAPKTFTADVTFSVDPAESTIDADVTTEQPGLRLAYLARTFENGPNNTEARPRSARVTLEPVPQTVGVTLHTVEGELDANTETNVDDLDVDIESATPTRADIVAVDAAGDQVRHITGTLDKLSDDTHVGYTNDHDQDLQTVDYDGSAPIATADVHVQEFAADGTTKVRTIDALAHGIPDDLDLTLDDNSTRFRRIKVIDYDASAPVGDVDATVKEFKNGVLDRRTHAIVTGVPTTLDITEDAASGIGAATDRHVTYDASTRVPSVDVTLDELTGDTLDSQFRAILSDLPPAFTLHQGAEAVPDPATTDGFVTVDGVSYSSDEALGSIEGGFSDGRAVQLRDDISVPSYISLDNGDVAFRANGITQAAVGTAPTGTGDDKLVGVDLDAAPGPLALSTTEGDRTVVGALNDVPASVNFVFDPAARFSYAGSDTIGLLDVRAADPTRIVKAATAARVRVEEIPADLDLTFAPSGDGFALDAGPGQRVGTVFVDIRSHEPFEDQALAKDEEGLTVTDVSGRFIVQARVHDLERVEVSREVSDTEDSLYTDTAAVELETAEDRVDGPFRVYLEQADDPGDNDIDHEILRATMTDLPHELEFEREAIMRDNITIPDSAQEERLHYEGEEELDNLTVETNFGDREHLRAVLRFLGDRLDICQAKTGACTQPHGRVVTGGSLEIDSSKEIAMVLTDCVQGVVEDCQPDTSQVFMKANLALKELRIDKSIPLINPSTDIERFGHIFIDTDGNELDGSVDQVSLSTDPCVVNTPKERSHQTFNFSAVTASNRQLPFKIASLPGFPCQAIALNVVGEGLDGLLNSGRMACGDLTQIDLVADGAGTGRLDEKLCNE